MKKIFLLSGENLDMAKQEVLALAGKEEKDAVIIDNVVVLETEFRYKRLALTKRVYQYLFECEHKDLEKKMEKFDWNRIFKKSFSLRIVNIFPADHKAKEAELAKYIWHKVEEPRVDLKHAPTKIEIIVTSKKIYVGKVIYVSNEEFTKRSSHLRPANIPVAISPKYARAAVNLTGIQTGSVLTDPFCGTGGILLEAGLMRFNTRGYDISDKMLKICEKNLDYYKIRRFHLEQRDATKLSMNEDYIVSDLPYGMNQQVSVELEQLYLAFLIRVKDILQKKAVLIFPHFVDYKKLIQKAKLKKEKEFSLYVHKNLTRKIVVLSNAE